MDHERLLGISSFQGRHGTGNRGQQYWREAEQASMKVVNQFDILSLHHPGSAARACAGSPATPHAIAAWLASISQIALLVLALPQQ